MWPKNLVATGITLALPLMMAVPVRAELASGSVLNIASQGVAIVPDRQVTIELEESNRLVFRSGQTGRLLPTANQGSQLTLGLGTDRQINILPSSAAFANAYADTRTSIQDLPLNSLGVFQGEIPGFIQNIWLKTAGGAREVVSFTLFSVKYNPQTGQGEMTGAFVAADGKEQFANGGFNLDPSDGCACNYTLQLEVQTIANSGGPPGGGSPPGPIGGSTGGGLGGAFPLLVFAALPFLINDDGGNGTPPASNPLGNPANNPLGNPSDMPTPVPTTGNNPNPNPSGTPPNTDQPPDPVPTPALLPGLMGLIWKARQRHRQIPA